MKTISSPIAMIAALVIGSTTVIMASPGPSASHAPAPAPAPYLIKRDITLSLPIIGSLTLGNNQDPAPSTVTSTLYSTITSTTDSYSSDVVSSDSGSSTPASSTTVPASLSSSYTHKPTTHSHVSSDSSASPSVIIVTQTVQVIVTASMPPLTNVSTNSSTSMSSSTFALMSNTVSVNDGFQSVSTSSTLAVAAPTADSRQGDDSGSGSSSRTTAGIAVGSILGGIGAFAALGFIAFKYKRRNTLSDTDNDTWYPDPASSAPEMEQSYTYASPSASLGRRLSATLGLKSNAAPPPTSDIEANPAAAAWWAAATAAANSSMSSPRPKSPLDDSDAASIGNHSDDTVRPRTPTTLFGFARKSSQHGHGHSHSSSSQPQNSPRPNSPSADWDPFRSALDNYHVGR